MLLKISVSFAWLYREIKPHFLSKSDNSIHNKDIHCIDTKFLSVYINRFCSSCWLSFSYFLAFYTFLFLYFKFMDTSLIFGYFWMDDDFIKLLELYYKKQHLTDEIIHMKKAIIGK